VPYIAYGQPKTQPPGIVSTASPCIVNSDGEPRFFQFPVVFVSLPDVVELTTVFIRLLLGVTTGRDAAGRVDPSGINPGADTFRPVVEAAVNL
jgi:hypothetical protein